MDRQIVVETEEGHINAVADVLNAVDTLKENSQAKFGGRQITEDRSKKKNSTLECHIPVVVEKGVSNVEHVEKGVERVGSVEEM